MADDQHAVPSVESTLDASDALALSLSAPWPFDQFGDVPESLREMLAAFFRRTATT